MYLSLSLYLSVPSYFSLSLPFCWSGHVFSWSPPVLQGFRFGLEGWKSLNPAQWMKQSVIEWVNDQGRSRAARAAKNIRMKLNSISKISLALITPICHYLDPTMPPLSIVNSQTMTNILKMCSYIWTIVLPNDASLPLLNHKISTFPPHP